MWLIKSVQIGEMAELAFFTAK